MQQRSSGSFAVWSTETAAAANIPAGGTLIFYCQDGARSSLGALAAVKAGFRTVTLCYLSYLDWQSDPSDPVET